MKFAAVIEYTPDKAKIAEFRPPHREYQKVLKQEGKVALAGPLADDSGGIIVYEAASKQDVEDWIRADPFATGGVFVSWVIHPWNLILANRDLLPA
jgi:uncharacterized protein YciI